MSGLYDVLNEKCPNGVPFYTVGEICKTLKKGTLPQSELVKDGRYPVMNSGRTFYGRYDLYNNERDTITVASRGEYAGYISYISERFWAGGLCYPITSADKNKYSTKFIYYALKSKEQWIRDSLVAHGSIPALNKKDLEKVLLPMPPIDIQLEIVRILDDFTELTAELSAELTAELIARKKQYNEYLNVLTEMKDFRNPVSMSMGELFDFRNGLSKGKEFFGHGIPFIRYTDVYNNRFLKRESITALVECTEAEKKKLKVSRGDVLFTRTSETAEDVGWSSVVLEDLEACVFNGFTIKATPKTDLLLPEYCAYCFSSYSFRQYVTKNCAFTTRASLTGKTISEYIITIPDIEEQREIVSILDKLYALCNSFSSGLPAEIEARQKQYEYYRDKLLTFKELS